MEFATPILEAYFEKTPELTRIFKGETIEIYLKSIC